MGENSDQSDEGPRWKRRRGKRGRLLRSREAILADWHGPEKVTEELVAFLKKSEPLNNTINEVFHELGMHETAWLDQLKEEWSRIVGTDIAKRSQPVALRNKTLQIEVFDTAWYYELTRSYSEDIKERVRTFSNGDVCTIKFTPQGRNYGGSRYSQRARYSR